MECDSVLDGLRFQQYYDVCTSHECDVICKESCDMQCGTVYSSTFVCMLTVRTMVKTIWVHHSYIIVIHGQGMQAEKGGDCMDMHGLQLT